MLRTWIDRGLHTMVPRFGGVSRGLMWGLMSLGRLQVGGLFRWEFEAGDDGLGKSLRRCGRGVEAMAVQDLGDGEDLEPVIGAAIGVEGAGLGGEQPEVAGLPLP